MRHILFVLITMLFTFSLGFAHEVSVKDLFGRTVHTPDNVDRILAIGPGALRLIVYAGAQDKIVGRELFEDKLSKSLRPYTYKIPKNYYKLPVISAGGPGKMPDIEKILMTKAKVIFAVSFTKSQMDTISRMTNIPVVGLSYGSLGHTDINTIMTSIRQIGYIAHTQDRTQDLINKIAIMRKDIIKRVDGAKPKSVFMASVAYKGSRGFNSTEREHPSCQMLNLNNIADDIKVDSGMGTHIMMQIESILKSQPEYIFYDVTGFDALKKEYGRIYPLINLLSASKGNKIYSVMPYNWYNSNVENIFLTAYFMGKVIYPERFADVDIALKAGEIYNNFLQIDPYRQIADKEPIYRRITFEKDGIRIRD